jgi:hypothetical protein
MSSLMLWAVMALAPTVGATSGAGCDACDCCGCCESGACVCKDCSCCCCKADCCADGSGCGSGCSR